MGIAELLGVDEDHLRQVVAERCGDWLQLVPAGGVASSAEALDAWRRDARPGRVNVLLMALAHQAAVDGLDDSDAALVLAWLMLPAALRVRQELSWVQGPLDESIAAQLWVEVRTIPWRRPHRVAPRIAWRLRDAVRSDLSVSTRDRVLDLPVAELPERPVADADESAGDQLGELLDWARAAEVITDADRVLLDRLLSTIRQLDEAGASPRSNRVYGLGGDRVAALVAEQLGVNLRTVRRRTAKVIAALSSNAPRYFEYLAA